MFVKGVHSTVANTLEMLYEDTISETVYCLRVMNYLFVVACMNVRILFAGRNKRNPDFNHYRSTDDDRLRCLKEDFLQYFPNSWCNSKPLNVRKILVQPSSGK